MVPGDPTSGVDLRVLAAALRAVSEVSGAAAVSRAVLREVYGALPFAFGLVLRLRSDRAEVVGLYPAAMAGVDVGVSWSPLDVAEQWLARLGEPSLDGSLRPNVSDRSPLTRLPAFGMRSALRVPLYAGEHVVGSVALYRHESVAFSGLDGIALEQYVRALGPLVGGTGRGVAPDSVVAFTAVERFARGDQVDQPGAHREDALALPHKTDTGGAVAESAALSTTAGNEEWSVLGELVSGAAHDLNNRLTTILGYAELLPALDGEDRHSATVTIEQEARRAGGIVRDLLRHARPEGPPSRPRVPDPGARAEETDEVKAAIHSTPAAEELSGRGEHVLVVEDEPAVRSLLSTILGTSGYHVLIATSVKEALDALVSEQLDLVVSDLQMPGLGGEALFEQIWERWPQLRRRVLFVSGDIEANEFGASLRERSVRYLEKPFSAGQLLSAARSTLEDARGE